MERCAQTVGPETHPEPPARGTPSTVTMVVLENIHYYQVRITARPLEPRCDLVAVEFMLPRDMDLPEGPTPLLPGTPPDPLTAFLSGRAGNWHAGQRRGGSTWMAGNRRRSSCLTTG